MPAGDLHPPRESPVPAAAPPTHPEHSDLYLYALIAALVLGAWGFTRLGLYATSSNIAYWLGVAGGVAMLLLLTYPMRKHLRVMRRAGPASRWFFAHMVLGVLGPLLILLHSNFHVRSLNAAVAFYSMLLVAGSGVVGRFLYLRLHRGLSGQKLNLSQMRDTLQIEHGASTRLQFAPQVVRRCEHFERWAIERRNVTPAQVLRAMVVVPWIRWRTARACRAELRRRLVIAAHAEGWTRSRARARLREARRLTDDYLAAAQGVAMFSAWERLFSWWHIAHVPLFYLLVVSAIVHVVAVHAY